MLCNILYITHAGSTISFSGHLFSAYTSLWPHYINPFSSRLTFAYCWFFLDNITFHFHSLRCSSFDHYCGMYCHISTLPPLLAFIDGLVKFYSPIHLIFLPYQHRVSVFQKCDNLSRGVPFISHRTLSWLSSRIWLLCLL